MVKRQRRFYLATSKTDERKYGKICSECITYRHGKPSPQCRLNQVYDANDILFGNADDAYAPTIDYDDSVTQTRSRITESCVEVYETLRPSAERNMQYCIVRVKSFTGLPPTPIKNQSEPGRVGPSDGQDGSIIDEGSGLTSWIVSSSETADVSDVVGHHADAAETEETESADPRLCRRLENEPTSPLTTTEVNDADEEPVRTRPRRTIRRPRWFNY